MWVKQYDRQEEMEKYPMIIQRLGFITFLSIILDMFGKIEKDIILFIPPRTFNYFLSTELHISFPQASVLPFFFLQ